MDKLKKLQNFWKNKNVFITGHTGFKGTWFIIFLNLLGANVYGYSLKAKKKSLFNIIDNKIILKNSKIGDVRDYKSLKKSILISKADIIFHFAAQALVTNSYRNPKETFETNIIGLLNLLNVIKNGYAMRSLLILTTDKVYKDNKKKIYKEADELGGNDPYSASKVCKEIITRSYIKSFFENSNLKNRISVARSGNVIGTGDFSDDRLIPDMIESYLKNKKLIIRNPEHIRPWQHVIEPLYGYLLLAEKQYKGNINSRGYSWNFGPEKNNFLKVKKVLYHFEKITKNKLKVKYINKIRVKESNSLKLNNSKSKKYLNWRPKWDVEKTLKKTVELEKLLIKKKNINNLFKGQIIDYLNKRG